MKRLVPILLAAMVLMAFLGTVGFLVAKSREKPVIYATHEPAIADIVKKTVATGAVVPRNEVEIKSRVSGVVSDLPVEPGEHVSEGDLIAVIRIIPDLGSLASAESSVASARIARDAARIELDRDEALHAEGALSIADLDRTRREYSQAEQTYTAAQRTLRIVKDGHAGGSAEISTHVRSTVSGMVLSVDVKEGESVTETNTFNAGTTIAVVADMSDMIFEGKVDESEVGKIKEGMDLAVTVGALGDKRFKGTLEYISPKGLLEEGAVQFEIEAAIEAIDGAFIRAGSSANAAIVLDRRDQVLAINESVLQFEDGKPYVEVETSPQTFERRDIEVGLSDGIQIEIMSGLGAEDKVKGKPLDG